MGLPIVSSLIGFDVAALGILVIKREPNYQYLQKLPQTLDRCLLFNKSRSSGKNPVICKIYTIELGSKYKDIICKEKLDLKPSAA